LTGFQARNNQLIKINIRSKYGKLNIKTNDKIQYIWNKNETFKTKISGEHYDLILRLNSPSITIKSGDNINEIQESIK